MSALRYAFHELLRLTECCCVPETVSKMPCSKTIEVRWVPSGGHNPLDTPKSRREESNAAIMEAIGRFVSEK